MLLQRSTELSRSHLSSEFTSCGCSYSITDSNTVCDCVIILFVDSISVSPFARWTIEDIQNAFSSFDIDDIWCYFEVEEKAFIIQFEATNLPSSHCHFVTSLHRISFCLSKYEKNNEKISKAIKTNNNNSDDGKEKWKPLKSIVCSAHHELKSLKLFDDWINT